MKYTKYEKARIIGARALQIAMGAPILLDLKEEDFEKLAYNPINIAKKEYDADVLPITIRRPLPPKWESYEETFKRSHLKFERLSEKKEEEEKPTSEEL
ncbi:MAG: DNA-directed RNA polymerase subunit K [Candidatus Nanoarchaeia archaeon]